MPKHPSGVHLSQLGMHMSNIGAGYRTASIKLYPQEFFERIVAITSEYFV
ncbi:MAG TPA: hypothetical protein V6D33_12035 [Cyanophyceae cyanobacterium]